GEVSYSVGAELDPDSYRTVARAVFAEMLAGAYTSVGEFHYVHHAQDGTPYGAERPRGDGAETTARDGAETTARDGAETTAGNGAETAAGNAVETTAGDSADDAAGHRAHAMERALARAAASAGIRIRLLDTCYLTGAIAAELSAEQARCGDGTIAGYLDRHTALSASFAEEFPVRAPGESYVHVGAAIHSIRAVPAANLPRFTELTGPVHVHLSEQPAENDACHAAYGTTPTQVLARSGVVGPNLSAVHATHLSEDDIAILGQSQASIVMCPATEA